MFSHFSTLCMKGLRQYPRHIENTSTHFHVYLLFEPWLEMCQRMTRATVFNI